MLASPQSSSAPLTCPPSGLGSPACRTEPAALPQHPKGGASVAPLRLVPVAQGLLSAVGPRRIARLQSLYEVGCIIT